MEKYWVYINGYRVVETRSIGYKWVFYRTTEYSRYKRIKRSEWDKCCISTLAEVKDKINIINKAIDNNISLTTKSRNKFGWKNKPFDQIKLEVESRSL
tara:strand:- start:765 stop:1058 length:294 start_codon:yes stop_codon:yes gene_type:complete